MLRAPAFQSKFCFREGVTSFDLKYACEAAAKDTKLSLKQEAPGRLLLTPGVGGRISGWGRATVQVTANLISNAARTAGVSGNGLKRESVLQNKVSHPKGLGVSRIRIIIKMGAAARKLAKDVVPAGYSTGFALEVTSCNVELAEEFIKVLGNHMNTRMARKDAGQQAAPPAQPHQNVESRETKKREGAEMKKRQSGGGKNSSGFEMAMDGSDDDVVNLETEDQATPLPAPTRKSKVDKSGGSARKRASLHHWYAQETTVGENGEGMEMFGDSDEEDDDQDDPANRRRSVLDWYNDDGDGDMVPKESEVGNSFTFEDTSEKKHTDKRRSGAR